MYYVEISHPHNKYLVTPIRDSIITLEGIHASLPYGSTSGKWGDSGAMFTEQYGTPIGADVVYYARYENKFYHLKAEFPVEKMKDLASRAYAVSYVESHKEPLEHYKRTEQRQLRFSGYENPYTNMTHLIFGFAPQGMVVVWVGYGGGDIIEVERYQAQEVKDDEKYAKIFFTERSSQTRQQIIEREHVPEASSKEWDDYRNRYSWRPVLSSDIDTFFALQFGAEYYNGEREYLLQPYIMKTEHQMRAIPNEVDLYWRTDKNQQFEGRVFFNWEKTDAILKEQGLEKNDIRFHINKDNNIEVFLNDMPLPVQSIRVYKSNVKFQI